MSNVKERPILMSAPMVLALLDGSKTQTRRAIKPQPVRQLTPVVHLQRRGLNTWSDDGSWSINCPYGVPGDRLWVRETWCVGEDKHNFYLEFRADSDGVMHQRGRDKLTADENATLDRWANKVDAWNPSIFMPRWASRITLEITGVRVERLQDMEGAHETESDALKEGVNRIHHGDGDYYYSAFRDEPHGDNWTDPSSAFRELWESINGPGSWERNDWVWVIEFRRINAS